MVLCLPLVLAFLSPVSLRRSPKPDDRAVYALKAVIEVGGDDDVRFSGTFVERVKSVEGTVVTTTVESRVTVDVMGVVRESRPVVSDRVERLDGTLLASAKVDGTVLFADPRVDRLRAFYPPVAPVEVGAGWWHMAAPGETPLYSSYLQLLGEEKMGAHDAWRLSVDANEVADEHPTHVRGVVWLDKADGSLVCGQWTIEGFAYSPAAPPLKARLELSRMADAATTRPSAPAAGSSGGIAPRTSPSLR